MQSGHKRWCVLRALFVKTSVFSKHKAVLVALYIYAFSPYRNPNRRSLYSVCLAGGYNGDSPLRAEVIKKLSREISRGGPQKIEKKFAPAALKKWAATRGLEGESWEMAERGKNGQMHSQTRGGKKCLEPFSSAYWSKKRRNSLCSPIFVECYFKQLLTVWLILFIFWAQVLT